MTEPAKLPIIVAHYDRGKDSTGAIAPFHWSILIPIPPTGTDAYAFQILGNMDTFELSSATIEPKYAKHEAYRGAVVVGSVPENELSRVNEVASRVAIYRYRNDWNCQNWVIATLDRMKPYGFVGANVTENGIRNELAEQEARWQEGESVYGEAE